MTQITIIIGYNIKSDKIRKKSIFKRYGISLTNQEFADAKHGNFLFKNIVLFRSKKYRYFKFDISTPGLPGYLLEFDFIINKNIIDYYIIILNLLLYI